MPYETGTTTGFADLLSRIETFALANGWSKTGSVLHKGTVYVTLVADTVYLSVEGGTGESAGVLTGNCDDPVRMVSVPVINPDVTWPATYHLVTHASPDFFFVVLNSNTTDFQFLNWGVLEKYGTWVGGNYVCAPYCASHNYAHNISMNEFTGSSWLTSVGGADSAIGLWFQSTTAQFVSPSAGSVQLQCDLDASAGNWYDSSDDSAVMVDGVIMQKDQARYSPNTFNDQSVLVPILVTMERPSSMRSILGDPIHVRYVNTYHHDPGDIITLGADKWIVFPHYKFDRTNEFKRLGYAIKYDGP